MKKVEKKIEVIFIQSTDGLNGPDREILAKARQMTNVSYAPYSRFYVGAACRMSDGSIVTGCNQENASFPSGLCAERVALFAAGAAAPGVEIEALAIATRRENTPTSHPIAPCGACRQVITEFEHRQQKPIRLILAGETGDIAIIESAGSLLPFRFDADQLFEERS